MFNHLYIKEKSLSSCLHVCYSDLRGKILRDEFCIMIWSSKHTDPVRFGWQTKQLVKMRSSFNRLSSKPLRHDTSILKERNANTYYWSGYIWLVCWMLWHLLSLSLENGKVFGYRVCSNATRAGWCMWNAGLVEWSGPGCSTSESSETVCESSLPSVLPCAPSFSPLHLISSLFPWSVRNSFWPGHVVYFQTCVQLA